MHENSFNVLAFVITKEQANKYFTFVYFFLSIYVARASRSITSIHFYNDS